MATETQSHDHHAVDNAIHERDYTGFITMLKWAMAIVAIIAATVIYIISN